MPGPSAYSNLSTAFRGVTNLHKATGQYDKSLGKLIGTQDRFLHKMMSENDQVKEAIEKRRKLTTETVNMGKKISQILKRALAPAIGLFSLGAWETGLQTMGQWQELANEIGRATGSMQKQGQIISEMISGANALGISYEQYAGAMRSAAKYGAQFETSGQQFNRMIRRASEFGEAVGMGAERGAEMMGKFMGYAKLAPKEVSFIQDEFVRLQRAIGITGDELSQMAENITPIIAQMKNLGATAEDVRSMVQSTNNLVAAFSSMGRSAGEATTFVDRLLDPTRLQQNYLLYSRLGVSLQDALGAMQGQGTDNFLNQVMENLPKLGRQIASMGVIPGQAFAQQLGLDYREALQFQQMDSDAFKERMKRMAKERADEQAFQKQLNQTIHTWQRWFVTYSQQIQQIVAEFASIMGGGNFARFKGIILDFARSLNKFIKDVNIGEYVATGIDMLRGAATAIKNILTPISNAIRTSFDSSQVRKFGKEIARISVNLGNVLGEAVKKYLPKILEGLTKALSFINSMVEKMGPGSFLATIAGLLAGKTMVHNLVEGKGLTGLLGKYIAGKFQRGGSRSMPLYVENVSGIGTGTDILNGIGSLKNFKNLRALRKIPFLGSGAFKLMRGMKNLGPAMGEIGLQGGAKGLSKFAGPAGLILMAVIGAVEAGIRASDTKGISDAMAKKLEEVSTTDRMTAGVAGFIDSIMFGLLDDKRSIQAAELTRRGIGDSNRDKFNAFRDMNSPQGMMKYLAKFMANYFLTGTSAFQAGMGDRGKHFGYKGTEKLDFAQKEAIMRTEILGVSINMIGDWLDQATMAVSKWIDQTVNKLKQVFNNLTSSEWWGQKIDEWKAAMIAKGKELWQSLKDQVSEIFSKKYWYAKFDAMVGTWQAKVNKWIDSMSDGWKRFYWRLIWMLEGLVENTLGKILGVGEKFKNLDWTEQFSKEAMSSMKKDFDYERQELNKLLAKAQKEGDVATYNAIAEQYNARLRELKKRADEQTEFYNYQKETGDEEYWEPIKIHMTELSMRQEKKLEEIASNTGTTSKNTEIIAQRLKKPTKFVDLDALAARSNEQRDVYLTYQTMKDGYG